MQKEPDPGISITAPEMYSDARGGGRRNEKRRKETEGQAFDSAFFRSILISAWRRSGGVAVGGAAGGVWAFR